MKITVPLRKRAHYGVSVHPPLWAQFAAKVKCLVKYVPMQAFIQDFHQRGGGNMTIAELKVGED